MVFDKLPKFSVLRYVQDPKMLELLKDVGFLEPSPEALAGLLCVHGYRF